MNVSCWHPCYNHHRTDGKRNAIATLMTLLFNVNTRNFLVNCKSSAGMLYRSKPLIACQSKGVNERSRKEAVTSDSFAREIN